MNPHIARRNFHRGADALARAALLLLLTLLLTILIPCHTGIAQESGDGGTVTPVEKGAQTIDLATALRLAGAQNVDVQIARTRLDKAKAEHAMAMSRFFPWLAPGFGYRRHGGNLQESAGKIIDVDKQQYTAGAAITAEVDLGDAIYSSLAAKQLVGAAGEKFETQRQQSIYAAAVGYLELLRAEGAVGVAREASRIARDYAGQVNRAVEEGIAFKGDLFRARTQAERNEIALRRAIEERGVAAARLAESLRLDPSVALRPRDSDLVPMGLADAGESLGADVAAALGARPELRESHSRTEAARRALQGVKYGPLIPTVGAGAEFGGLGGGVGSDTGNFDSSEEYAIALRWRIGPGGLFDKGRRQSSEADLEAHRLGQDKIHDAIIREVVEARTRVRSLREQIGSAQRTIEAAEETLRLTGERKEFGVGIVLEYVQAEQDLTLARLDYLTIVADFNKAQYALLRATGRIAVPPVPTGKGVTARE